MENLFVVPCAVASFLKVESTGVKFLTFRRKEGKNGVENGIEKSLYVQHQNVRWKSALSRNCNRWSFDHVPRTITVPDEASKR